MCTELISWEIVVRIVVQQLGYCKKNFKKRWYASSLAKKLQRLASDLFVLHHPMVVSWCSIWMLTSLFQVYELHFALQFLEGHFFIMHLLKDSCLKLHLQVVQIITDFLVPRWYEHIQWPFETARQGASTAKLHHH